MVHKASSSSLTFPHFPVTSREVILENIIVISSLKSECLWYMGPARGHSPRYLLWRLSWANKFYIILSGRERRTRRLPWPCQTHTKSNLDCDRVTFKVKQYKSNRDDVAFKMCLFDGWIQVFHNRKHHTHTHMHCVNGNMNIAQWESGVLIFTFNRRNEKKKTPGPPLLLTVHGYTHYLIRTVQRENFQI